MRWQEEDQLHTRLFVSSPSLLSSDPHITTCVAFLKEKQSTDPLSPTGSPLIRPSR